MLPYVFYIFTKGIMGNLPAFIHQILLITINQSTYGRLSFSFQTQPVPLWPLPTYSQKSKISSMNSNRFFIYISKLWQNFPLLSPSLHKYKWISWWQRSRVLLSEIPFGQVLWTNPVWMAHILYIFMCYKLGLVCEWDVVCLVWAAEVHSWVPEELARL